MKKIIELGDNMRFIILCLIMLFIYPLTASNANREYEIIKLDNVEDKFIYIGCILIDKNTKDTVSTLLVFPGEYYINYYIYGNNFFMFEKFYQGTYNPPLHELLISRYDILSDTILFKDNYSFGHYPDSVSSKFEENTLTIFKGDSIIEFDLDKFEVIKRFKNKKLNKWKR
jgi:hypothetical protein